jgi:hypothetical protein
MVGEGGKPPHFTDLLVAHNFIELKIVKGKHKFKMKIHSSSYIHTYTEFCDKKFSYNVY